MTKADTRPLRMIGYCRVSTAKQGENGYGLGAQRQVLERFCEQQGHELLTVTTDVVSGGEADRMYGRQVAIAAIEAGVADALLVRALDRATRDQLDHARLFKQAERNAWRLMDCEGADSGAPHQRLVADIRNAVAAEERRKISERTKEGLAKARKAGKRLGRPPQIDPAVAKRIVDLRMRAELSANAICGRAHQAAGTCAWRRREVVPDDGARRVRARRDPVTWRMYERTRPRRSATARWSSGMRSCGASRCAMSSAYRCRSTPTTQTARSRPERGRRAIRRAKPRKRAETS